MNSRFAGGHGDESPVTDANDLELLERLRRIIALLDPPPAHVSVSAQRALGRDAVAARLR